MKIKNILMLSAILLVFSCEQDPLTLDQFNREATIDTEAMVASGVTKTIKFKRSSGTISLANLDGCSGEGQYLIKGKGIASHLGKFTVQNTICPSRIPPIMGILTAANGDQIFTYVNATPVIDDDGIWYYQYAVYGGSGRFEGVTGELSMYGTIGPETWSLKGEGTITYP